MASELGLTGTVIIATKGADGPGKVELTMDLGTECYIAYSQEPIPKGKLVVVYNARGGRTVDVEPLDF